MHNKNEILDLLFPRKDSAIASKILSSDMLYEVNDQDHLIVKYLDWNCDLDLLCDLAGGFTDDEIADAIIRCFIAVDHGDWLNWKYIPSK